MKKSAELRQELNGLVSSQTEIMKKAGDEKRVLTPDEAKLFDDLQSQIDEKRAELGRVEKHEESVRSMAGRSGESLLDPDGELNEKREAFSLNKAIRSLIKGEELSGAEKLANDMALRSAKESGIGLNPGSIAIPMMDARSVKIEKRADGQTVTQDSGGYGGNLVATDVMAPIDYLMPKPVASKLGATMLTGLVGNLLFPKNNGGVTATWEGEVDGVINTKDAIGKVEMSPKRLAVSVLVSLQNIMQSTISMEMYTMNRIRKAIEAAIDEAFINGSGSGQPTGILNTSGVNTVAIGVNGGAWTLDKAIDMETEVFVDNADADSMYYLSNSKVCVKAKKTVIETGQTDKLLQNNEINGYPYANSNYVPSGLTKGTSSGVCSAAIFGDFSKAIIGQWNFMDLSVDNVSRKKEGYIEITANVYLDIAVTEPKAFCVVKDLTT